MKGQASDLEDGLHSRADVLRGGLAGYGAEEIPNVVPGNGAVVSSSWGFRWPTARRMALMSELFPAFCAPTCMRR